MNTDMRYGLFGTGLGVIFALLWILIGIATLGAIAIGLGICGALLFIRGLLGQSTW